ncbi:hypothetical protein QBC46DRAFT_378395 [Diplogelasinospora grovesii]|uniref:DUF7704 domain-containing protein n=1 Tax=Diplogelasinospora grovesii TaxID=303347 RepID=A0AAN6NFD4_9PEZI|nr:hypothetical protein QBC46DRAFT_378395 [Diplogelasinospora grovesii]
MASQLPAVPRFVFTVFEPISLLAGFFPAVFSPDWFITEQIASLTANTPTVSLTENSRVVARQLGNCYGLAFLVAIAVLYSTTEIKVVRNYLVALWIADIGHLAITYLALGHEKAMAIGEWNPMTWGNVGVTLFLCLTRTAYLLGLFGPGRPVATPARKMQ